MKVDWTKKLGSRKFWALLAGFVGSLLVVFHVSDNSIAQITAIITAFGSVAVYIFAEASVDKAAADSIAKEGDPKNE